MSPSAAKVEKHKMNKHWWPILGKFLFLFPGDFYQQS